MGSHHYKQCVGYHCFNDTKQLQITSNRPRMVGWNVHEFDLHLISEHWRSYPALDFSDHYKIAVVCTYISFFAIVGNYFLIKIFCTTKQLRSPSGLLVLNLALADLVSAANSPFLVYSSYHAGYALPHSYCKLYAAVGVTSGVVQAATNTCIAYDRYRIISDPTGGQIGTFSAVVLVIFTWGMAVFWAWMPFYEHWSRFVPDGYLTSCSFDYLTYTPENRLFVLGWFICCFLVPITISVVFYLHVLRHVMDIQNALKVQASRMNVATLRGSVRSQIICELRACRTALVVAGLFVISWTPGAMVALIGAFGNQSMLTPSVAMVPALACKLAACIDPYVYAISHPRFRRELQRRYPGLNLREPALLPNGPVRNGPVPSGTLSPVATPSDNEPPTSSANTTISIEMSETQIPIVETITLPLNFTVTL